jgi:zinc protease
MSIPPLPALAQAPVHRFTLENGLQVFVEEDHRKPRVAVAISYGAGTVAEPRGYRGIAMLAQRLVYLGSRHLPDGSAVPTLEHAGATNFDGSLGADWSISWSPAWFRSPRAAT